MTYRPSVSVKEGFVYIISHNLSWNILSNPGGFRTRMVLLSGNSPYHPKKKTNKLTFQCQALLWSFVEDQVDSLI